MDPIETSEEFSYVGPEGEWTLFEKKAVPIVTRTLRKDAKVMDVLTFQCVLVYRTKHCGRVILRVSLVCTIPRSDLTRLAQKLSSIPFNCFVAF